MERWLPANNVMDAFLAIPTNFNNQLVMAEITGTSQVPGSLNRYVALNVGFVPGEYHLCRLQARDNQPRELVYDEITPTSNFQLTAPWAGTLVGTNTLAVLVEGTLGACAVAGTGSAKVESGPQNIGPHTGGIAIGTTFTAIDIAYVFVARAGP